MFVVTVPVTARVLLRGQLQFLREEGFDVTLISSPGPDLDLVARREGVRVIGIPLAREISPLEDTRSLVLLTRALRQLRPDIVNASTAKAGLLGMLAARAVGVPQRVYLLRGLRLETESGAKRLVLGATERIASSCAQHVVCVSASLRDRYIEAGYARADKCLTLGAGASNGVELQRFERTSALASQARQLRADLGLADADIVIGFVGRPVADKGIVELLESFEAIAARIPRVKLLILGAGFAHDHIDPHIKDRLRSRTDVRLIDHVDEPAPYYAMMDILAFPSHREGFPNAPLEAAAAGVPTVGFAATGITDAVVSGATGMLVTNGDREAFERALEHYVTNSDERRTHGENARARVIALYDRRVVWKNWLNFYRELN